MKKVGVFFVSIFAVLMACFSLGMIGFENNVFSKNGGNAFAAESPEVGTGIPKTRGHAIYVASGSTYTMSGGTISGLEKSTVNYGGAVYVESGATFIMTGGTIEGTISDGYIDCFADRGGAIYVESGATFLMQGGTIKNIQSYTYGGAVYVETGATFIMQAGTIENTMAVNGGAIYMEAGATCTLQGGKISGCESERGGAINIPAGATCTLEGVTIDSCVGMWGAAIYSKDADLNILMQKGLSTTISNCHTYDSSRTGGAIQAEGGSITFEGGTISGCSASWGGAIYAQDCDVILQTGTITGCTAVGGDGGGVYIFGDSSFVAVGTSIQNCTADSKGNAMFVGSGTSYQNGSPFIKDDDIWFDYTLKFDVNWIKVRYKPKMASVFANASNGIHISYGDQLEITKNMNFGEDAFQMTVTGASRQAGTDIYYVNDSVNVEAYGLSNSNSYLSFRLVNNEYYEVRLSNTNSCPYEVYIPAFYNEKPVRSIAQSGFARAQFSQIYLPYTLTTIGAGAFSGCSMTELDIPDGVTSIGESAFNNCSNMFRVKLPSGITSIEKQTFYRCGLLDIIIPDSVTSIGVMAFEGCSSMKSVVMNSATTIGERAFNSCDRITSITLPIRFASVGARAFRARHANIFYRGDQDLWAEALTKIDSSNDMFFSEDITVYYFSYMNPYISHVQFVDHKDDLYWHFRGGDTTTPLIWDKPEASSLSLEVASFREENSETKYYDDKKFFVEPIHEKKVV